MLKHHQNPINVPDLLAKKHIVAATTPLPVSFLLPLPGLALAVLYGALAAVPGEGVGDGRGGDAVYEGCLSVVFSLLSPGSERCNRAVPNLCAKLLSTLCDG